MIAVFTAPASIKNQINGFCNDSAGNLVLNAACPTGTFTPTYSYDAENRLIATGGISYTYDGDGRRVKKSNGMLYWTGTGSGALLETDLSGNPAAEYVFFNGRRIARSSTNTNRMRTATTIPIIDKALGISAIPERTFAIAIL